MATVSGLHQKSVRKRHWNVLVFHRVLFLKMAYEVPVDPTLQTLYSNFVLERASTLFEPLLHYW